MNICILAGGSGTRLWPKSRKNFPKQFLPLISGRSLFQDTVLRVAGLPYDKLYVICNEDHRFLVAEQLREIDIDATIILESQARNTAPAIGVFSHFILQDNDNPTLVLAADHYIQDGEEFCSLARDVLSGNQISSSIILFGIQPLFPATGYGYIRPENGEDVSRVLSFTEKPDLQTAKEYLDADSGYLWNSGIFMFRPNVMLAELENTQPLINSISRNLVETSSVDLDFIRLDPELSAQFPDLPIDIAVLEKSSNVYVRRFNTPWSDVGTWKSLYEVKDRDSSGNAIHGDVMAIDSTDNLLISERKLIVAMDVSGLAVVETDDAILVATLASTDRVGAIVKQLSQMGRKESVVHREVHRPWGKYDSIDSGERYQVKRITVKPGGRLSLQMHHHRAEHWIVVKGTAKVTIDDSEILLSENQSTFIPLGATHRLENPGSIPLEMIEVQSGSYLGEDDIVRFQDTYGRCGGVT